VKSTKRTWIFLALAFGFSWTLAGIAYLAGLRLSSPLFGAMAVVYMFGPLGAALLAARIAPELDAEGKSHSWIGSLKATLALRFKMGWGNFFIAWLLLPTVMLLAFACDFLMPGVKYDPKMGDFIARYAPSLTPEQLEATRKSVEAFPLPMWTITLLQGLVAGLTINAIAAFGEEAGWRGYLTKSLSGSNPWIASLFIGAIWGLWHAPIIIQGYNYPQHPLAGVFMMIAWCSLLGPLFTYIRLRSRSTIAAAIAHGSLNGTAGVAMMAISGGSDLLTGALGLAGFVALILANLAILLVDRRSKSPVMSVPVA
jgi:membrane protease YdiL (CAAX protease family)